MDSRIPLRSLWSPVLLALVAASLVVGCGRSGGGSASGRIIVDTTDAPFPAIDGCLASALLEIDQVSIKRQGDAEEAWRIIPLADEDGDGVVTVNLLELRNGLAETVAAGELETGLYSEIRLRIVSATLVFADGSPSQEFKVPSGMTSGLKIKIRPSVAIAANQTTPLMLDVDVSESFHTTGLGGSPTCDDLKLGENQVIFSPVVRAMDMNQNGVITGTVEDTEGTAVGGAEVTAFLAGTVVDGDTVSEASTFSAEATTPNAALGSYALLVEPGTYDVYVRAQGVETRTLAAAAVVVGAGEIVTRDLAVPTP